MSRRDHFQSGFIAQKTNTRITDMPYFYAFDSTFCKHTYTHNEMGLNQFNRRPFSRSEQKTKIRSNSWHHVFFTLFMLHSDRIWLCPNSSSLEARNTNLKSLTRQNVCTSRSTLISSAHQVKKKRDINRML